MKLNLEKTEVKENIRTGDIIVTRCKSGRTKYYLLVDNIENDREEIGDFILIDLEFYEARSIIPNDMIEDYIENSLEETILEVILEKDLVLSRK